MLVRRRYDLPLGRDGSSRLVPWIVALMSYLAALGLAGAMLLGVVAWRWTADVSGALTVLLPAADGIGDAARVERARGALRGIPGVASVEALDAASVARRLEPWLGSGASAEDLPLPRLLIVRVSPGRRPDPAALRQELTAIAPGAVVDDHGVWRAEIARLATRVMALAGFAVGLIALAGAAVVVFAVRSGLAVHRETIEVLHLIGAHDDYIARQFQNHTARLSFLGGLIGLALLALTEGFLVNLVLNLDPALMPRLELQAWQWAALAALPGVVAFLGMMAIAAAASKHTVRRALTRLV